MIIILGIIQLIVSALDLFAGTVHIDIWYKDRRQVPNLLFGILFLVLCPILLYYGVHNIGLAK